MEQTATTTTATTIAMAISPFGGYTHFPLLVASSLAHSFCCTLCLPFSTTTTSSSTTFSSPHFPPFDLLLCARAWLGRKHNRNKPTLRFLFQSFLCEYWRQVRSKQCRDFCCCCSCSSESGSSSKSFSFNVSVCFSLSFSCASEVCRLHRRRRLRARCFAVCVSVSVNEQRTKQQTDARNPRRSRRH